MGILGSLFKTGGDTIKGTLEGAGTLAKDIRTAITNEVPAEKRAELEAKALQMESEVKKAQSEVIIAEAKGDSWLQRNWRPIVMLGLFALIIADCFGVLKFQTVGAELGVIEDCSGRVCDWAVCGGCCG